MKKAYALRHQAAGVLTDVLFAEPPTDEQLAPLLRMLDARHGDRHRKTGEPHWTRIVEIPLLEPNERPVVATADAPTASVAGAGSVGADELLVSGAGRVQNPER